MKAQPDVPRSLALVVGLRKPEWVWGVLPTGGDGRTPRTKAEAAKDPLASFA